jgi:hypothetical protein
MDPPSKEDDEFTRRGLPNEGDAAKQIRKLKSLGVTDIAQISPVDGTEEEVRALPSWCDEHQLQTIVFVAHTDHTRRLRRVLDRIMKGHATRVMVKPARYTNFDLKVAARTVPHLTRAIRSFIPQLSPSECANYFAHAGYASK